MILNVSYGNKDALVRSGKTEFFTLTCPESIGALTYVRISQRGHSGGSVKLETDTKYVFFIQVQRLLEGTKTFTTTTPQ